MLILASRSPRRIRLIKQIAAEFTAVEPDTEEISDGFPPRETAIKNAKLKALSASRGAGDIVLGADTVVALYGKIYGKPADADQARSFLRQLSGNTHEVYTGVCVVSDTGVFCGAEKTLVTFNALTDNSIDRYVESGLCFNKAGAYGLQDGFGLVKGVEGSKDNVIGLPLKLSRQLIISAGGKGCLI